MSALEFELVEGRSPFPPEGFVGREQARLIFGISMRRWSEWEHRGRITCGKMATIPGKPGQCKIYPRALLEEIKMQWDREATEAEKCLEPYPDPERRGVWRVPVKRETGPTMEALIDEADLPVIAGKRWNWSIGQSGNGSVVVVMTGSPKPSLPRILLGISDPIQLVAHRNGDRLDCRRANLIVRTRAESARAKRKIESRGGRVASSPYKGVCWHEDGRKWGATIRFDNRTIQLGRFRNEIQAALAYDAAAKEMFGEHARLNFPDGVDPKIAAESATRAAALEPAPVPPGMIDRYDACAMFDISINAWHAWEEKGRINCHHWFPMPDGKPGRQKWYPLAELERLREEFAKLGKPYLDANRPGVVRVPLRSHVTYREAMIDEADLPLIEGMNWNWSEKSEGKVEGHVVLSTTGGGMTPLQRIILQLTDGRVRVQFANGDALDCRRKNLLMRSPAEQVHANGKMKSQRGRPCTSRFKGVAWCEDRGKYVAQIRKDGVHRHLGRYHDEIAAAEAYDEAAKELFGEHAYLNFPDGVDAWLERESAEAGAAHCDTEAIRSAA